MTGITTHLEAEFPHFLPLDNRGQLEEITTDNELNTPERLVTLPYHPDTYKQSLIQGFKILMSCIIP